METNKKLKVLVACEYSGIVRDAFKDRGHNATSCDLLPTEKPGNHLQCDVAAVLEDGWDLIIAHPPCTYLCNSGVRWLYNADKTTNTTRWDLMRDAAGFFVAIQNAQCKHIAIENPVMHKHALALVGRKPDQVIQPWQFGHGETKATGLWLKGLPPLRPTKVVDGREQRIWRLPPGPDRWKERSRTFGGIAQAMAQQWGAFLESL